MPERIDLYDSHYSHDEADVYRAIRRETFGEDLRQASWITAPECDELCSWLGLFPSSAVLEVACGSGGVALRIAERFRCSVVGVDINEAAISAATRRSAERGGTGRTRFRVGDGDEPLPFDDDSFDAVFCNDAINHLKDRERVLADWHRLLKVGGRCLYTDPVVVTGCLTKEEIAARSSIGFFLFTPVGANEALLDSAGFSLLRTEDVMDSVVTIAGRWLEARSSRRDALVELEGELGYDDVQRFLQTVHALASERRLSRFAYLAERSSAGFTGATRQS